MPLQGMQVTVHPDLRRYPRGEQQVGTARLPERVEQPVDPTTGHVRVHGTSEDRRVTWLVRPGEGAWRALPVRCGD